MVPIRSPASLAFSSQRWRPRRSFSSLNRWRQCCLCLSSVIGLGIAWSHAMVITTPTRRPPTRRSPSCPFPHSYFQRLSPLTALYLATKTINTEIITQTNFTSTTIELSPTADTTVTTANIVTNVVAESLLQPATTSPSVEIRPIDVTNKTLSMMDSAFALIAARTAECLYASDIRRDAIGKAAGKQAAGSTNWIDEATAFRLQQAIDLVQLNQQPSTSITTASARPVLSGVDQDEVTVWLRWLKATPYPGIVDLSAEFRIHVSATIPSDDALDLIDQKRPAFLRRVGCRLLMFPSGGILPQPLVEPSASLIYGKLLYGGVTRSRLLGSHAPHSASSRRRASVRTEVMVSHHDPAPAWIMYGGPDRLYEAVDMGSAAVLEVYLLPPGKILESSEPNASSKQNMVIQGIVWKPENLFVYRPTSVASEQEAFSVDMATDRGGRLLSSLAGSDRNDAFRQSFASTVGGLSPQIDAIVRRVLDGRVIRPAEEVDRERAAAKLVDFESAMSGVDRTTRDLAQALLDAQELALLGLEPVRGVLLYGAPGTGKTMLAREISRSLRARAPKIVSAPELLDRWVGGSEKLVRALFADAEAELASVNGDMTRSALHVIVIDEIDSVFRKRSSSEDSGESTRSSVVNQILAKLDGVNAIPNVLLIGMTNRRELLDEALLRPGRLEVQIEVPLPNVDGRREILNIHFRALRQNGRLSRPLCCAIDGVPREYGGRTEVSGTVLLSEEAYKNSQRSTNSGRKRDTVQKVARTLRNWLPRPVLRSVYDLASDSVTGGFSGADIAGLVRCAGSIALARSRNNGNGVSGLLITLDDVKQALAEVKSSLK